jgi:hypothetical protein
MTGIRSSFRNDVKHFSAVRLRQMMMISPEIQRLLRVGGRRRRFLTWFIILDVSVVVFLGF